MQVDEYKNNNIESIRSKYGVDNVFQLENIKDKSTATMMERYGVTHNMQVEEFRQKSSVNRVKSLYLNGNTPKSKQQVHIHQLIGGIINYPVDKLSLDIAFPEDKIYLEYNGGGHDLGVKIGSISKDEFRIIEIKRYKFLKSLGWKQIVIDSPKDYLPEDCIILKEVNDAFSYLKNNDMKYHYNIFISSDINNNTYGILKKTI